jgi:hypothetical protein
VGNSVKKIEYGFVKGDKNAIDPMLEFMDIPEGAIVKFTIEWDNPIIDDFNPEDVAKRMYDEWKRDQDERDSFDVMVDIANEVATLERKECAEIARHADPKDGHHQFNTTKAMERLRIRDLILARTNENAGYTRLES